jgi:hypothetical protein
VVWQADQADEVLGIADVQVAAIIAVHGAGAPWGLVRAEGVTIVSARRVPDLLQALPPRLGPERVAWPTEPGCGSVLTPDRPPRVAQACPSLILGTRDRS